MYTFCIHYSVPATGGGLFSVDKEWFTLVGSYDELMDIWGCDNIGNAYYMQDYILTNQSARCFTVYRPTVFLTY